MQRCRGRIHSPCMGVLILFSLVTHAQAQTVHRFVASISPAQNIPPSAGSNALGAGAFVVDTDANTFSYRIVIGGLSSAETIAAIHLSPPGVENSSSLATIALGPVKVGTWTYPEAREADILAGNIYIDIHSANFPGGEARGQVQTHAAQLDGAQAVPPTASTATGWGTFMIDTSANTLRYYIVTTDVSGETAAHIRGPAAHALAGPILHTLPAGSIKSGTWTYPQVRERDLLRGLMYVNIETASHPTGDIRGQIVNCVVPIDGQQESPPVSSMGIGVGLVSLGDASDTLTYDVRYSPLSSAETAAHIHGFAPRGMSAAVVHPLALGSRKLGSWNYPAADESLVQSGLAYFNIHTMTNGGGEIRGQIEFPPVPCAGDYNGDGSVSSPDFFEFLTGFFVSDADFNGDGATNSQDFFDFLGAFFEAC
ncbi:MAG: CHRD domain-containing protein [Phycisphaerales bacterium]